jgi:hypothetical protein
MSQTAYLDIDQGSDFSVIFELENDDGTPMDLSGFSVYSQFRKSYNSLIGYNFVVSIADEDLGKISLALSGSASSVIKPGRYLYDVEIRGAGNRKTRVVQGIVTINPEITKTPVL